MPPTRLDFKLAEGLSLLFYIGDKNIFNTRTIIIENLARYYLLGRNGMGFHQGHDIKHNAI